MGVLEVGIDQTDQTGKNGGNFLEQLSKNEIRKTYIAYTCKNKSNNKCSTKLTLLISLRFK